MATRLHRKDLSYSNGSDLLRLICRSSVAALMRAVTFSVPANLAFRKMLKYLSLYGLTIRWRMGAVLFFGCAFLNVYAQKSDSGPGAQRFMEYCAACHGADGQGGDKAPSLAASSSHSDSELFRIVHDGTRGGMPPFAQIGDSNIRALVQFVRSLQRQSPAKASPAEPSLTGDANTGRTLYFGKAECSNCHMVKGEGGFIARSLTSYGRNRTPAEIFQAITNPDNPLESSSQVVSLITKSGQKLTGVLRNEDNFTLALQTEDGRYHLLERNDVANVDYTKRSLMPRDYDKRLSSRELNDIVSFLIVTSRTPRTEQTGVQ